MGLHSLIRKAKQGISDILPTDDDKHSHTHQGHDCHEEKHADYAENRFCSFVPPTTGNAKWYVDGASYFWAVSMAIEGIVTMLHRTPMFLGRPFFFYNITRTNAG